MTGKPCGFSPGLNQPQRGFVFSVRCFSAGHGVRFPFGIIE